MVVILATSLLAAVYVWRVIEVSYFRDPPADSPPLGDPPLALLVPTWLLTAACVYFGVEASLTVGFAEGAAIQLMGGR